MHAYLFCGIDSKRVIVEAQNFAKSLGEVLEFTISKIEDVRALTKFVKLSFSNPTAIFIKDIDKATVEALNAFLKNLEEPRQNLKYVLTATSEHKLIPTVVSRCQVIRIRNSGKTNTNTQEEELSKFFDKSTGEKLLYIENLRGREEAVAFVQDLILFTHSRLLTQKTNHTKSAFLLKKAQRLLEALLANGNVALQLTNFVIQI